MYRVTIYDVSSIDDHCSDGKIDDMCLLAMESIADAVPVPNTVYEANSFPNGVGL